MAGKPGGRARRMSLALVTAPAGEPLQLTDVKVHMRVDGTADDVLISGLITSARQKFDGKDAWFGRALLTQTWDLFLDAFPSEISVPLPPLQSVTTITYIDTAGTPIVLAGTEYTVDNKSEPGRIVPAYGKSWPVSRDSTPNAVTVRFVGGYGNASAVPEEIKTWLKQAVAHLYLRREAPADLPASFFWSMANYKVGWSF